MKVTGRTTWPTDREEFKIPVEKSTKANGPTISVVEKARIRIRTEQGMRVNGKVICSMASESIPGRITLSMRVTITAVKNKGKVLMFREIHIHIPRNIPL